MRQRTWRSVLTISATAFWWPLAVAAALALGEAPSYAAPLTEVPPPTQTDSGLDLLDLPSSKGTPAKEFFSRESTLFEGIPSVYGAAKYDQKVNEAPDAVIIIISSSAQLDAHHLAQLCQEVEVACRAGTLDSLPTRIPLLVTEHRDVCAAMRQALPSPQQQEAA